MVSSKACPTSYFDWACHIKAIGQYDWHVWSLRKQLQREAPILDCDNTEISG
jgi:hypothetical protein